MNNSTFNINTHRATAFNNALTKIRKGLTPPFQCEVYIVELGVQKSKNRDLGIRQVVEEEQFYYILSTTFIFTKQSKEEEKMTTVNIARRT